MGLDIASEASKLMISTMSWKEKKKKGEKREVGNSLLAGMMEMNKSNGKLL